MTYKCKICGGQTTIDSSSPTEENIPSGTYTIVEEATDEAGKLWGKLKSGVGWICVSDISAN